MASSNSYNYNNPELSAVLKTLSTFAAPAGASSPPPTTTATTTTTTPNQSFTSDVNSHHFHHTSTSNLQGKTNNVDDGDDEYEPSDVIPPAPAAAPAHGTPLASAARQQTTTTTTPPAKPNPNANSDPSTITTWPAALKHVMRAVSQNEALQARIRRLIRSQHEHERQWWQGREALIAKQKARVEKKRQLDEVL